MIRQLPIAEFSPSEDQTIWDVREPAAYREGHLQYAKNQPLSDLSPQALAQTEGSVYVLCGGGTRAGKAAAQLEAWDSSRDIVILTGGTRGARAAGLPIVVVDKP